MSRYSERLADYLYKHQLTTAAMVMVVPYLLAIALTWNDGSGVGIHAEFWMRISTAGAVVWVGTYLHRIIWPSSTPSQFPPDKPEHWYATIARISIWAIIALAI